MVEEDLVQVKDDYLQKLNTLDVKFDLVSFVSSFLRSPKSHFIL